MAAVLDLTTAVQAKNGNRFEVVDWKFPDGKACVTLNLLRVGANAGAYGVYTICLSDIYGESERIQVNENSVNNMDGVSKIRWSGSTENLATDLQAAVDAASGRNNKKAAILTHGLSSGWIDSTLTGTVTA
jgi:hypothetical protein